MKEVAQIANAMGNILFSSGLDGHDGELALVAALDAWSKVHGLYQNPLVNLYRMMAIIGKQEPGASGTFGIGSSDRAVYPSDVMISVTSVAAGTYPCMCGKNHDESPAKPVTQRNPNAH